jgi:hypothetical protein
MVTQMQKGLGTYPLPASSISLAVSSLTCILFGSPLLSIRAAVLTVYNWCKLLHEVMMKQNVLAI